LWTKAKATAPRQPSSLTSAFALCATSSTNIIIAPQRPWPPGTNSEPGGMSGQQSYYRQNEAYAEFLASWDAGFYSKFADTLKPEKAGTRVLDVGCGVGQVVARLTEAGCEAHGVDVSEPNIER